MKQAAAVSILFLLSGCGFTGSIVKSAAYSEHGGLSPAENDAEIAESIEHELAREAKGEHPHAGKTTWADYWQWRYLAWRRHPGNDKWVAYTRHRRQELRLRYI